MEGSLGERVIFPVVERVLMCIITDGAISGGDGVGYSCENVGFGDGLGRVDLL